ncbi:helical backbone metal receptor [Thermovibrio ammonificans]
MIRLLLFVFLLVSVAASAAERVVSLSPALTETLFFVGAGKELVGVTRYCTVPRCKGLKRVGGIVDPNVEVILSLKPTLVVATTLTPERYLDFLKSRGVKVERFRLVTLKDVEFAVERLGNLLGGNGSQKRAEFEAELRAAVLKLGCLSGKRVVLLLGKRVAYVAGSRSYLGEALEPAGAKVYPDAAFEAVSWDYLCSLSPDVVVLLSEVSLPACLKKVRTVNALPLKDLLLHPSPVFIRGLETLGREVCR